MYRSILHRTAGHFFLALFIICALPAKAELLQGPVIVEGPIVTIGDFFTGAGKMADIGLFRAPDPGKSGYVSVAQIITRAKDAGFSPLKIDGRKQIEVRRRAQLIGRAMVQSLIDAALRDQWDVLAHHELDIDLPAGFKPLYADINSRAFTNKDIGDAVTGPEIYDLDWDRRRGRFSGMLIYRFNGEPVRVMVTGHAREMHRVLVLTRALRRGEWVAKEDLASARKPVSDMGLVGARDKSAFIGKAAKRGLRAGQLIKRNDFELPRLVSRGEKVTLIYQNDGLLLTGRGQALSAAAMGESVDVVNLDTRRTVPSTVIGPGRVQVRHKGRMETDDLFALNNDS